MPCTDPRGPARARSIAGQALWSRMYSSFGYLTAGRGYGGHIFPVVFGETGTFLTAVRPSVAAPSEGSPRAAAEPAHAPSLRVALIRLPPPPARPRPPLPCIGRYTRAQTAGLR